MTYGSGSENSDVELTEQETQPEIEEINFDEYGLENETEADTSLSETETPEVEAINYEEYGGMLLLGVKGITVISHGRSKAYAIKNAVRVAKGAVESGVNRKIAEHLGTSD